MHIGNRSYLFLYHIYFRTELTSQTTTIIHYVQEHNRFIVDLCLTYTTERCDIVAHYYIAPCIICEKVPKEFQHGYSRAAPSLPPYPLNYYHYKVCVALRKRKKSLPELFIALIVEQISGKIWHNRGFNDKSVKTSKIVHLDLLNKIGYGPIA